MVNVDQADGHMLGGPMQALQVRSAGEVLGRSLVGLSRAEHGGAVEGFLVVYFMDSLRPRKLSDPNRRPRRGLTTGSATGNIDKRVQLAMQALNAFSFN